MNTQLTFADLKSAIRELGDRFPKLNDDDLFVTWFLRAYVTESEEKAVNAVTGGARDKGIDGLLIDDSARAVLIVQAKYRQQLSMKNESRNDVVGFAEVAQRLSEPNEKAFQEFLKDTDEFVADRLREARKKVLKRKYRVWLYFVTTGKVSPSARKDVHQLVRKADCDARIEIVDGKRAMLLFRDYLDGVAPPIPTLDLEMESGQNVKVNGVAQRFDHRTKVESWVFSMRGDAVAELYERAGLRLFARNIRGFLGMKTSVNEGMIATLDTEPERFFYYNNGITIVCDEAEKKSSKGRDFLKVGNPQIINGQQTTRTLAAHAQEAAKGSVLVKVIQVPRNESGDGEAFEEIVSRIVAGTNWQNAIKPSDLMSNDRRQIELERALRKIGYLYIRKRQTKGEAKKLIGGKQYYVVKKEEFAQAVAGCDLDPMIIRSGREKLFEEELYSQVFPNSDPDFYLPRYRLMREVTWCAKGFPSRGYAKWLALNFMWSHVLPLVSGHQKCRAFRILCERQDDDLVVPLSGAIDLAFDEVLKYYRANRGKGESALDVSQFFKNRKNHHEQFEQFWKSITASNRKKFDRHLTQARDAIAAFDN